ncbi:hypothetical protein DY000_02001194 [Brassica cretica]|uniref:Uncharacterized protein n=1 Tax=Brassica cretica TaxID=69181 RepID=A0ABQ7CCN4_BRACR|nr:hypothetical protein DY000_02001194 [Brassica cretica]
MGSSPTPFPDIGRKAKVKLADCGHCSLSLCVWGSLLLLCAGHLFTVWEFADLLNKDYIFDQKFTLTMLSATEKYFLEVDSYYIQLCSYSGSRKHGL